MLLKKGESFTDTIEKSRSNYLKLYKIFAKKWKHLHLRHGNIKTDAKEE
jgi:hypothetical protein